MKNVLYSYSDSGSEILIFDSEEIARAYTYNLMKERGSTNFMEVTPDCWDSEEFILQLHEPGVYKGRTKVSGKVGFPCF